jgi:hypothetical protein
LRIAKSLYLTEASVMGYRLSARTLGYLERHGLAIDQGGVNGPYDLIVTCSDQVIPRNIRQSPIVLVQEGMTDPEGVRGVRYGRSKGTHRPRWCTPKVIPKR